MISQVPYQLLTHPTETTLRRSASNPDTVIEVRPRSSSQESLLPKEKNYRKLTRVSNCYYLFPLIAGGLCLTSTAAAIHALIRQKKRFWVPVQITEIVLYMFVAGAVICTFSRAYAAEKVHGPTAKKMILRDSVLRVLRPEGVIVNIALAILAGFFL